MSNQHFFFIFLHEWDLDSESTSLVVSLYRVQYSIASYALNHLSIGTHIQFMTNFFFFVLSRYCLSNFLLDQINVFITKMFNVYSIIIDIPYLRINYIYDRVSRTICQLQVHVVYHQVYRAILF